MLQFLLMYYDSIKEAEALKKANEILEKNYGKGGAPSTLKSSRYVGFSESVTTPNLYEKLRDKYLRNKRRAK